jgi:hypothetical protein
VAHRIVEALRSRIPYIGRLHRRIDDLQHRLAELEAVPQLHAANGPDQPAMATQFRAMLHCLQPHDIAGVSKVRIGAAADGGYVMLDDFGPARHALSLGVGPEVSWEADIAGRGLRVFQYDDTVEASPLTHPNFVFEHKRVVGTKTRPADTTIEDILARPELATDNDVIVKMDIEGCEWDVLTKTSAATLARVRQLAIEFHELRRFADDSWRNLALAGLKNLSATHVCVHVHGNNWGPFMVIGGIPFPEGFEATFVRRRDYPAATPSKAIFPTALDRPSNPKRPDLYIGQWNY